MNIKFITKNTFRDVTFFNLLKSKICRSFCGNVRRWLKMCFFVGTLFYFNTTVMNDNFSNDPKLCLKLNISGVDTCHNLEMVHIVQAH